MKYIMVFLCVKKNKMRIFFAGALTGLKNPKKTKAFYCRLADAAQKAGFTCFWAFLEGTDPIKNPDVSVSKVYETDTYQLSRSDLMVAYVGELSTGTGIEIEFANNKRIPVYLLYEKGKQISRMVRGCPAIKKEIVFTDEADALAQFGALLGKLHFRRGKDV